MLGTNQKSKQNSVTCEKKKKKKSRETRVRGFTLDSAKPKTENIIALFAAPGNVL